MLFLSWIILVSALWPIVVVSQTSPIPTGSLPSCILNCLGSAATAASCSSFVDVGCVCPSSTFESSALSCLTSSCSVTDQTIADGVLSAICATYSGALSVLGASPTVALSSMSSQSVASTISQMSMSSTSSVASQSTLSTASLESIHSVSSTSAAVASSSTSSPSPTAVPSSTTASAAKVGGIVGGVLGAALLALIAVLLFIFCCRRRRDVETSSSHHLDLDWDTTFDPYKYQAVRGPPDGSDAAVALARHRPPMVANDLVHSRPLPHQPEPSVSTPSSGGPEMRDRSTLGSGPHSPYATTAFAFPTLSQQPLTSPQAAPTPSRNPSRRNSFHQGRRASSTYESAIDEPLSPSSIDTDNFAPSALALQRSPSLAAQMKAREAFEQYRQQRLSQRSTIAQQANLGRRPSVASTVLQHEDGGPAEPEPDLADEGEEGVTGTEIPPRYDTIREPTSDGQDWVLHR